MSDHTSSAREIAEESDRKQSTIRYIAVKKLGIDFPNRTPEQHAQLLKALEKPKRSHRGGKGRPPRKSTPAIAANLPPQPAETRLVAPAPRSSPPPPPAGDVHRDRAVQRLVAELRVRFAELEELLGA